MLTGKLNHFLSTNIDYTAKTESSFRKGFELIVGVFYSQLFIASAPNHWCRIPELDPWYTDVPELLKSLR